MTTIYNATDAPVDVDTEGRILGGRERADVDDVTVEPVAGHVQAGRLVVLADEEQPADVDTKPKAPKGRRTTTQEA